MSPWIKTKKLKLKLSILKPLHAKWFLDVYKHMTSDAEKSYIEIIWKLAGNSDAV